MIDKEYPDSSSDEIFNYTQEELRKFQINGQIFEYIYMSNQLGGFRWFFICSKCKSKVNKLFLPPKEALGYDQKYYCKKCHKLKNESVIKANNKLYRSVLKPLKKLRDIEKKLEIGHLKPDKVKELLDEYDSLEKEMRSTPEYRLYVFKKKRGLKI
jgi:superfamily II helicase